ncbi:MAG: ABC transporter transmembrane domain-containing protein, partial [Oliverpabstia sp.]
MKEMREMQVRRKGLTIMWQLIGLVIPLLPVMLIAIILGVLGYLCAIFLTIIAGYGLVQGRLFIIDNHVFVMLVTIAVMRGVLHYGEQYCNHFIAFKLLALIRHKVFATLRKLCPARLEGKDKGNLISIITSDIELLEVFYAHTISPIAIAITTSLIMVLFIGHYSPWAALLASAAYLTVGAAIPLIHGRKGSAAGMEFRTSFGDLNSFLLDSLRGVEETIQYNNGKERLEQIQERSNELGRLQKRLNILEASQRSVTNMAILVFSFGMLFLMTWMHLSGVVDFKAMLITTIAMMGSFGPVVALSNLSNNLNQTLASGERVLSLLEETPLVEKVTGEEEINFTGAEVKNVNFSYEDEQILEDYSISIPERTIIGIHGQSGSGKSTLLKLLMRFWDVKSGQIDISG